MGLLRDLSYICSTFGHYHVVDGHSSAHPHAVTVRVLIRCTTSTKMCNESNAVLYNLSVLAIRNEPPERTRFCVLASRGCGLPGSRVRVQGRSTATGYATAWRVRRSSAPAAT